MDSLSYAIRSVSAFRLPQWNQTVAVMLKSGETVGQIKSLLSQYGSCNACDMLISTVKVYLENSRKVAWREYAQKHCSKVSLHEVSWFQSSDLSWVNLLVLNKLDGRLRFTGRTLPHNFLFFLTKLSTVTSWILKQWNGGHVLKLN